MFYPNEVDLIMGTCVSAGFADHNFSEPTYSPASFTEGDASQAIRPAGNAFAMGSVAVCDVPGSDPLEGRGSEMTRPLEVSQVPKRKKKAHTQEKEEQIVFECLEEGGVRGKGQEPDMLSGDETSSAAEQLKDLPSSSGTTVSSNEQADPLLLQQVDCKDGEEVQKDAKGKTSQAVQAGVQAEKSMQVKDVEEAGVLQDMEDVQVEEPRRTVVKKRQSSESKKRIKRTEIAEEETFPTAMENLYSANATTLTALSEMVVEKEGEEGDDLPDEETADDGCAAGGDDIPDGNEGSQVPLQASGSAAAGRRVLTRSQDKRTQTTQVKRKKKRRVN